MDSYVDYYYIIDALGVDYNQSVWLPQTGLWSKQWFCQWRPRESTVNN